MSKVYCASVDCEHNEDNLCKARKIILSDAHIHTVHHGFKHIHECKSYEKSQRYKNLESYLSKYFGQYKTTEKGGAE